MEPDLAPMERTTLELAADTEREAAARARFKGSAKRLTEAQREQLFALSVDHTATQLSQKFGVSVPAVTALLQRHGLEATKAERLNAHAKEMIATSTTPVATLAAIFGVSTAHIYALRREHRLAQPGAVPASARVGNKVTTDMLATILNPALSAYDAARETGLSVPTIYNYRRKHKASAPAVEDLV